MSQVSSVRVAVVGVGNCCSSLVQGVQLYKNNPDNKQGLISYSIADRLAGDIEFSAAFDVDKTKVGRDLAEGIFQGRNNTVQLVDRVPSMGVEIYPSPLLDGVGKSYGECIELAQTPHPIKHSEYAALLKNSGTDVLVNYLPVGSTEVSHWWANVCLEAGVAMVNAIPVFVAGGMGMEFKKAGLPLIGDDIKSQFGATILHRVIAQLIRDRGFELEKTYQLNFGGNMDFKNMKDENRLEDKRQSKTSAVTSVTPLARDRVHIGPSDFVPWLEDEKWCYINCQLRGFAGAPAELEVKLKVVDSPNSAGVVVDAVRVAKAAMERGFSGVLHDASSLYMKSPGELQLSEDDAQRRLQENYDVVPAHLAGMPTVSEAVA